MAKTAHSKVAAFLTTAIDASHKSQMQIAEEAGFPRPNIISMLKMGITKLPIARVPAIAKSLDIDATRLFRLAMEEYMPELLSVCDEIYSREKLNAGEQEVISRIRLQTKGKAFTLNTAAKEHIDDMVKSLK